MQHPVGFTIRNGRAELTDFWAVVSQPFALQQYLHTISGAYILTGFVVMGVSAYHLLRRQHTGFFTKSFRMALTFALIFSIAELVQGHYHGGKVAEIQPTKLAAMESHWETQKGAPMYLFLIPDEKNEGNLVEFGRLPGFLSLLAFHSTQAEVKGLKAFPPEERPPVALTFVAFRIMVGLGFLFVLLTVVGWFKRHKLEASPGFLKVMLWAIPLPYVALQTGWIVAEVGRQPWIVYGLMKTRDAASPVAASQVGLSLGAFILVYSLLGIAGYYLMARIVRQGPRPVAVTVKGKEV
jgi:cytochrome d ubiquinol oxidase subunit I